MSFELFYTRLLKKVPVYDIFQFVDNFFPKFMDKMNIYWHFLSGKMIVPSGLCAQIKKFSALARFCVPKVEHVGILSIASSSERQRGEINQTPNAIPPYILQHRNYYITIQIDASWSRHSSHLKYNIQNYALQWVKY